MLFTQKSSAQGNFATLDNSYKGFILKGDTALNYGHIEVAKYYYTEGIAINPANSYPYNKIAECNKLIWCNAVTQKADSLFLEKNFSEAKRQYDIAFYKCHDTYSRSQRNECGKFITIVEVDNKLLLDTASAYVIYDKTGAVWTQGTGKEIEITLRYAMEDIFYLVTKTKTILFRRKKK